MSQGKLETNIERVLVDPVEDVAVTINYASFISRGKEPEIVLVKALKLAHVGIEVVPLRTAEYDVVGKQIEDENGYN